MNITLKKSGKTETVGLQLTKLALATDAEQTYAFEEGITVKGQSGGLAVNSVQAIEGNLYIAVTGTSTTPADYSKAINAVVAAVKG